MLRLITHPKISPILNAKFLCYRQSIGNTDKSILEKYKVTTAPMLVIFDAKGKVIHRITNPKTKPSSLTTILNELVNKSESNLKKSQEKTEKTND